MGNIIIADRAVALLLELRNIEAASLRLNIPPKQSAALESRVAAEAERLRKLIMEELT